MANHEAKLQMVTVQYLNIALPPEAVFWGNLNESRIPGKRGEITGKHFRDMGRLAGLSDLMIFWGGKLHCIELKLSADKTRRIRRSKQSEAQKTFERRICLQGARYAVCRSIHEVGRQLAVWGIPTREKVA